MGIKSLRSQYFGGLQAYSLKTELHKVGLYNIFKSLAISLSNLDI